MKNLLIKEFKLAMHPTVIIFLGLSLLILIPGYPLYVTFFYMTLGLFFVCLSGRENNDIAYTLVLPVQKRDAARARILFAVMAELALLTLAALVAILRGMLGIGPNQAGMDANIAFFGLSLILMGVFNHSFFIRYYAAPQKVGSAFVVSSLLFFVLLLLMETCVFILPIFRDRLDTPDPLFLAEKLIVLALGAASFALLSWRACLKSEKNFEQLDF